MKEPPAAEGLRSMPGTPQSEGGLREGGKYPVPSIGDRALALYQELHQAARETAPLPPYCAIPTRTNRDQGVRALVGDRVLVLEFDARGHLTLRDEPLQPNAPSTDK